ncbi:peptidase inhibitor family I36 protein [Hymenobacter terrenus]|uniref:peptidase inhibitor family I36 protein n=1 Tax=Hymenobacter terrenus TaxID=1629124 RepID=UPI000697BC9B|nr:peptidase inhibitor family I36 protein [Hymenobacter terrenus]
MFADDNFQGEYITAVGTNDCLDGRSFNDRASSLRVRPAGTMTLYQDCYYGGYARALPAIGGYTTNRLLALGIDNNDISSLRVNSGYEVVLYDEDDYQGTSITISGSNDCLVTSDWNDRVSSVQVRTVGAPSAALPRKSEVDVYPNPVVDKLHLSAAAALTGGQYRILNGWGKAVASGRLTHDIVDVEALPTGMYTLVLVAKDGQTVARRFDKIAVLNVERKRLPDEQPFLLRTTSASLVNGRLHAQ